MVLLNLHMISVALGIIHVFRSRKIQFPCLYSLSRYLLLGQGEVQKWAGGKGDEEGEGEEKVDFGLHEIHEVAKEDEEEEV